MKDHAHTIGFLLASLLGIAMVVYLLPSCDDGGGNGDSEATDTDTDTGTGTGTGTGVSYEIPDTGQEECYGFAGPLPCDDPNVFDSQDAHYDRPRDFLDNSDDTVTDTVTGLIWQQGTAGPYNWYEAAGVFDDLYNTADTDVCGDLVLAGESWRLPTRRELVTLVNHGYYAPAIEMDFPMDGSSNWTADELVTNDQQAWSVRFLDGFVSTLDKGSPPTGVLVRCVAGDSYGLVNDFEILDVTAAVDNATGLKWHRQETGAAKAWDEALEYCQLNRPAGYRLPDINELESIVDLTRDTVAVDQSVFPNIQPQDYWSSTPQDEAGGFGSWVIYFATGERRYSLGRDSAYASYVVCVNDQ